MFLPLSCGGDADTTLAPTLDSLVQASCAAARTCQCWSEASRQSCSDRVSDDFAWLEQQAAERGWTFDADCVARELKQLEELGCRSALTPKERVALEEQISCRYFNGTAAANEPCESDFDCTWGNYCDQDRQLCVPFLAEQREGLPCGRGGACSNYGTLWCDFAAGGAGICTGLPKEGEACEASFFCDEGLYCSASTLLCERLPAGGQPCASARRMRLPVCASSALCNDALDPPMCERLGSEGQSCLPGCAAGLECRDGDGACGPLDVARCSCVRPTPPPGIAVTCNFTDHEHALSALEFRLYMPPSRRELARLRPIAAP